MHNRYLRALATAASAVLFLAAGATVARAETLEAHIPFSFIVNGTRLPAGHYELRSMTTTQPNVWEVENTRTDRSVLLLTGACEMPSATTPQLHFAVMGGQHFLAQIVPDTGGQGRDADLTARSMERQLVRADRSAG
jgi:hypothetical protein